MLSFRTPITDFSAMRGPAIRKPRRSRHGSLRSSSWQPTWRPDMDRQMSDTLAIKQVVEDWVVSRDSGDWERFRKVWHKEGVMMATWFQGSYAEFIRVNEEGWKRGVSILHLLGGTSVEIKGKRAIAQTKMTISQRAKVHDVLV